MTSLAPRPAAGSAPKALEAAVLRVYDPRGQAVGLGFLVSPDVALTCAHVVSAALGTPKDAEPAASDRLHVDLPLLPAPAQGGTGVTASVERWLPPQRSGGGDVAVLRLGAPLPGARPIQLVEAQDVWEHPVRAFGFPVGRQGGVWHSAVLRARQAHGWVQADLSGQGYAVSGGFSGGPVWDDQLVGVVGMMVQAEAGNPPVSYLIPTDGLLAAWPGLRDLALPPSPFRSLSPFQEADADVFHGRGSESERLAGTLTTEPHITIVGPSGSGKSSLALAGVVPRLRASGASVIVLRPASGSSPLSALAAALLPLLEPELSETQRLTRLPAVAGVLAGGGLADVVAGLLPRHRSRRLLVVVDQFEELLALGTEAVDHLAGVLYGDTLPPEVRVLTTLRADFLEAALAHPRLGPVLSRSVRALGPLGPEQLREAVTAPVDAIPSVSYEPHLADRILADTGTEPGALPLLGFTLDLLWRRQSGGRLTHGAYEELGGVTGALGAQADEIWAAHVPARDEAAARRLFTQLIRVPIGSAAATRRMVLRRDVGEDEWRIARTLATTRLLVTGRNAEGADTVELAHEALITGWEKLAGWAAEDRSFLDWRESLRHDMDRWERGDRARELLPPTAAMAGARQWLRERGTELTDAERDYLERGRDHHRSRARRRRVLFSGIGIVVMLAMVFGALSLYAQEQARTRQALANSRALTQVSQDDAAADPARSIMLAMAAFRTSPTREARNQLLRQYLTYSGSERLLSGLAASVAQFGMSRDGNVVLARSTSGRAVLFVHATDGTVRGEPVEARRVASAMVSPDGKRAAFVSEDGTAGWFEVNAGAAGIAGPVHRLPQVADTERFGDPGRGFAISADGRRVVVTTSGRLVWWDLDTDTVGGSVPVSGTLNGDVWISPDNRTLLAGFWNGQTLEMGHRLVAIDMTTGARRTVVASAYDYVPSGDRMTVVACRTEGYEAVLSRHRLSDGAQQGDEHRERNTCDLGAADETGRHVALLNGAQVRLVDLERRTVAAQVLSPSGTSTTSLHLVSVGGRLLLAGLGSDRASVSYTRLLPARVSLDVSGQRLTRDGSRVISVLKGGSGLQLRPTGEQGDRLLAEAPRPQPYWDHRNNRLPLDHDGRLFADWQAKNVVSVREVSTLRQTARVTTAMPPSDEEFTSFFDRSGNLVTVAGTQVQQWDVRTGQQLAHFDAKVFLPESRGEKAPVTTVVPYPVANQVAVLVWGASLVRVVDVGTGRTVTTMKVPEDGVALHFDPSGRYFALIRSGGIAELWRRHPLRKELGPLRSLIDHADTKGAARFLDGEGLFQVAANSTVRKYRIGTRAYLDSYDFGLAEGTFGSAERPYQFVDFSADGQTLIYIGPKGDGGPLRLDPALWQRALCAVIGHREFTAEERGSLPVHVPAEPLCPGR
ncbi:trypsin-like peptidase domain-containing protein [Streptomyces sp. NPDC003038]|uniref:nSTAND1 domain-containing NTPase n=1 Tax=unclassified Streptomyces TaxID=2593676 RepID=UPI0033B38DB4